MIVTEIAELSGKKSRVYMDEGSSFVLYRGELCRYGIEQGKELPEEIYRKLLEELLPRRARLRAMNLLKSRDYTEKQLCDKLRDGGYPETVVNQAMDYVRSFHYIDDLQYAVSYLNTFKDRKSLRRMQQELLQKGIGKAIMEQAVVSWQQDGGQDELQMACRLLEKRHYDRNSCDRREQQKLYGFLLNKGFSAEVIRKALNADGEDWQA